MIILISFQHHYLLHNSSKQILFLDILHYTSDEIHFIIHVLILFNNRVALFLQKLVRSMSFAHLQFWLSIFICYPSLVSINHILAYSHLSIFLCMRTFLHGSWMPVMLIGAFVTVVYLCYNRAHLLCSLHIFISV